MESDPKTEEDTVSVEASSDSFWDIGNFQRVVKRIENGARLCNDLAKMAQERIDIEAKYAKNLQQWSKKWDEIVSKGPEYGTLENGWKASLKEAIEIADIHNGMCTVIQREVIDSVQAWKADNFRKSIRGLKEAKRVEESFTLGQKPWGKRLDKTSRAKKLYFQSAHDLKIVQGKLHVAETNSDITPEQCAKIRDKCERTESAFSKAFEKYKAKLQDLQNYQPRYIDDLTIEFNRCQEAEKARMEFFKKTLTKLRDILDISKNARLPAVYTQLATDLSQISPGDDLQWYALNFGTEMSYNWPEFEEYDGGSGLKMSGTHLKSGQGHSNIQSDGDFHRPEHRSQAENTLISNSGLTSASVHHGSTSGGEEDWMEPPPLKDTGSTSGSSRASTAEPQGKLMRAIYDYTGKDKDDLSFNEGDIIRVVYEGENGWAEGTMAGQYGYVPIDYLEEVTNC